VPAQETCWILGLGLESSDTVRILRRLLLITLVATRIPEVGRSGGVGLELVVLFLQTRENFISSTLRNVIDRNFSLGSWLASLRPRITSRSWCLSIISRLDWKIELQVIIFVHLRGLRLRRTWLWPGILPALYLVLRSRGTVPLSILTDVCRVETSINQIIPFALVRLPIVNRFEGLGLQLSAASWCLRLDISVYVFGTIAMVSGRAALVVCRWAIIETILLLLNRGPDVRIIVF
jgi:hypothetical protein